VDNVVDLFLGDASGNGFVVTESVEKESSEVFQGDEPERRVQSADGREGGGRRGP
jgi:hypothetical protein